MSEDALELGCKISLISKAGIRYEGRLFTVDPDQCTIALSGGEIFSYYFLLDQYAVVEMRSVVTIIFSCTVFLFKKKQITVKVTVSKKECYCQIFL